MLEDNVEHNTPAKPTIDAPVTEQARLISLDILRGFAIMGILIVNIQAFAMIFPAYANPYAYGDMTGINYWVRYFNVLFADQKFIAIFSALFGASMMLIVNKAETKGLPAGALHYRRMFWLAVLGLIHALLIWAGDILFFYAVCGMVIYFFRNWRARSLTILGFSFLAIYSLMMLGIAEAIGMAPPEEAEKISQYWMPSQERINTELAGNRAGWLGQWDTRVGMYSEIANGIVILFFRLAGAMLLGMALYKAKLLDASRDAGFYLKHAVIFIALGYGLAIFGLDELEARRDDPIYSMFIGSNYTFIASAIICWGYMALVQWMCCSGARQFLVKNIAPVGQMALSNYLGQSIICGTIFFGWGFGLYGYVDRITQLGVVIAVCIFQIIFSRWWLARYRFGPAEWLWRSLSYMKKQPLAR